MKLTFTLFTGITLLFVTITFAQQSPNYSQPYQPVNELPLQPHQPNTPIKNQPIQTQPFSPYINPQPINSGTLQTQPMQTQLKSITSNGVLTYQNSPTQPPTQPTPGFNSPYPTNLTPPTQPLHPNHGLYQPNPTQPHNQPTTTPNGKLPLYGVGGNNGNNTTINNPGNGIVQVADAGRHVGRSVPVVRVHPFVLKQEEQRELDDFLLRWERYSETVNNYEVDFNAFFYDPTNPLSPPVTSSEPQLKPLKIMFGYFKYVAPRKFVYHIEGEWLQKERVKYINPEITPNVTAEKTIIDGQSLFFYDFPAKKVTQYRMPPEVLNRTIANGPFPLIFGAKAIDMKKRFSMKIVTNPDYRDKEIWLWAVPLLAEDQQEFIKIEIRMDKRTLNAMALKRIDPNEKSYTTYTLQNPRVNKFNGIFGDFFNPDVPRGWKHEIKDQTQTNNNPISPNHAHSTSHNITSPPNRTIPPTTPPRTEVPLYNP
ncbi:MAG: hypothetical protein LBC74_16030 [Planctomycetaceae bacterium]|jgi:TIGR03009 family protein|nr:hypothetical protein [Planctomycetaceae bacterium]